MFGPGNFSELRGHGEPGCGRLRLIGRQRLFFRLALGANRRLKCQTRSVLSGNMFDRSVACARRFSLSRCSAFQGEDHLSNFNFLAFFYFDVFDYAAD